MDEPDAESRDEASGLIEGVVTRLRSLLEKAPRGVRRRFVLPLPEETGEEDVARLLYEQRRMRGDAFGDRASMFVEPAWDLLLDLFVARSEGRVVSASTASIGACVPATTTLRCIATLRRLGLVATRRHPTDGRVKVVELTPEADAMLRRYLSALRWNGLSGAASDGGRSLGDARPAADVAPRRSGRPLGSALPPLQDASGRTT